MCSCGAETKPGLVVDPFMGSGTTGAVALKLGREFIGFELNPNYVKFAEDRIEKVKSGLGEKIEGKIQGKGEENG